MIRALLGMVPPIGWAMLLAIAASAGGAWCHRAGAAGVQARGDAVELERERQANANALRNANRARLASTRHETERAALARHLREARNATSIAMRTPISCPDSGRLGDLLLPAGALAGVRDAAASGGAAAGR
ncbi:MAG: hypothetical protein ACK4XK_10605 [Casimicrobiaceae bacterium]